MMIQPVLIAIKENGEKWELRGTEEKLGDPYRFKLPKKGSRIFEIPVGFKIDGASSPRWSWSSVGFLPRGIHDPAALVHDYLYNKRGTINTGIDTVHYTRKEADQLFYDLLCKCGVKSWHAKLAYFAVRAGGWYTWKG